MQHRWDIFCAVIDNFGDIGVCWRLAKQLTQDHGQSVWLWIDDLVRFNAIAPDVQPGVQQQSVQGVEIRQWQSMSEAVEAADVVIEAFACELPGVYLAAMLRKKTVWINLEYLSAESWVVQYHGLPSPHPRLPLIKTFFFPGFAEGTGGLLREKNLIAQREAFDVAAERLFFLRNGLPQRQSGEIRISLFCYDNAPVRKLISILSESLMPVLLIVPQGKVAGRIAAFFNHPASQVPGLIQYKQLTIQIIPFMEQNEYDRLLWSCDVNFVRGEDSFVRAQWAAHTFIWNIYPQTEGTHWKKLDAFLDLYTQGMPLKMAVVLRRMWDCWNGRYEMNFSIWLNFLALRESLTQHNQEWMRRLQEQHDLASNLVHFVENRL